MKYQNREKWLFDIKHLPGFRVPPIPRHGGGRGGCRGHLLPQNGEFRSCLLFCWWWGWCWWWGLLLPQNGGWRSCCCLWWGGWGVMMMMIEEGGELVVLFASLIWLWVVASNLSSTTLCPKLLQSTQQTVLWTVILPQGLSIFYRIKTTNCDFSLVKTSKSSTPNYTTQNNYTSLCNCLFHKDFQQSTGKIYKLWLF